MNQIMTPSEKTMTTGKIDKAVAQYRAMLEKHAFQFIAEPTQQVLGDPGLAKSQFELFQARVEAVSNLIIRHVTVLRDRSPQVMIDATHRKQYIDKGVLGAMPRGNGAEVEVIFFKVGRFLSDADLEKEYELRGLTPADPYSQTAVNIADPAFADNHPNGTHWKDADGNWCCATFSDWGGGRGVDVDRDDSDWSGHWWFAGLRQA